MFSFQTVQSLYISASVRLLFGAGTVVTQAVGRWKHTCELPAALWRQQLLSCGAARRGVGSKSGDGKEAVVTFVSPEPVPTSETSPEC